MSEEVNSRLLGGTEVNWCRAVSSGTGISVLALQVSKEPDISLLQKALHNLQNAHPILKALLHKNTSTSTFSFLIPHNPTLTVKSFDLSTTSDLLKTLSKPSNKSLSPFHLILEHELNINSWHDPCTGTTEGLCGLHVFFATSYTLPNAKWALALRLHTAVCDPITAVSLLHELMELVVVKKEGGEGKEKGIEKKEGVSLGIEDLIPKGKAKKTLWAHGMDMLGYSINSFRLTNFKFKDAKSPRYTEVVKLQMNKQETDLVLDGCKKKGIKLCGALAAAALITAHSAKNRPKKYGVVTLTDCRSTLQPALTVHNFGFYHSAILNIQTVQGGETLWDVANRCYTSFANSRKSNKHFTDMADLNYLMSKAIDNSSLTPSSSLRTSSISVFEDSIIDNSNEKREEIGLEGYIGCSSVHGVGPSIAIFDTIQDGKLDCFCVYPSPLHSRDQMQELVDGMKKVLVDG